MPISPPDSDPPPKWAQTLVHAANSRNRMRGSHEVFSMIDLLVAWKACAGRCAVSGLPFAMEVFGDGQAKRPFAPSLDRIDRHKPYQQDNVRLVVAIANFAMNAWGEEPLHQLANALLRKHGTRPLPPESALLDSDLDDVTTANTEQVETDVGTLAFPPLEDMAEAILDMLKQGPRSSRNLEDALAERFAITNDMRSAKLDNNTSIWRNRVAWALVELGQHERGTGEIECTEKTRAPEGGSMGIYRLRH